MGVAESEPLVLQTGLVLDFEADEEQLGLALRQDSGAVVAGRKRSEGDGEVAAAQPKRKRDLERDPDAVLPRELDDSQQGELDRSSQRAGGPVADHFAPPARLNAAARGAAVAVESVAVVALIADQVAVAAYLLALAFAQSVPSDLAAGLALLLAQHVSLAAGKRLIDVAAEIVRVQFAAGGAAAQQIHVLAERTDHVHTHLIYQVFREDAGQAVV